MSASLTSSVEFTGLTKLILDLQETLPRASAKTLHGMTKELGNETLQLYKENLNGTEPSTAEEPIPVGVRTGDLLAGAQLDDGGTGSGTLNQYAFRITNQVPYAGFIEEGTEHMAPRQPLQNALDVMDIRYETEIGKAMTTVTRAGQTS